MATYFGASAGAPQRSTSACAARRHACATRWRPLASEIDAAHAGRRGAARRCASRACTTCATRSPPPPARIAAGRAGRGDARGLRALPRRSRAAAGEGAAGRRDSSSTTPTTPTRTRWRGHRRARRRAGAARAGAGRHGRGGRRRAPAFHAEVGAVRAEPGIDALLALGEAEPHAVRGVRRGRASTSTDSKSWCRAPQA